MAFYRTSWKDGPIGPGFFMMVAPVTTIQEPSTAAPLSGEPMPLPDRLVWEDALCREDEKKKVEAIALAILMMR